MQQKIAHGQLHIRNVRFSAGRQHRICRVSAAATDSVIAGTKRKLLYDGVSSDRSETSKLDYDVFLHTRQPPGRTGYTTRGVASTCT